MLVFPPIVPRVDISRYDQGAHLTHYVKLPIKNLELINLFWVNINTTGYLYCFI